MVGHVVFALVWSQTMYTPSIFADIEPV